MDSDLGSAYEEYSIREDKQDSIEDALIDLYIKAAKRLILTADIQPEELDLDMFCRVVDLDLYIIFPLPVIGAMYERKQFVNGTEEFEGEGIFYLRRYDERSRKDQSSCCRCCCCSCNDCFCFLFFFFQSS